MFTVNKGIIVAVIIGAGAIIGVLLILPMTLYSPSSVPHIRGTIPAVSVVTIVEGASLPDTDRTFEPNTIKVVIGVNNTVRWINEDSVPSSIVADNEDDPMFYTITNEQCANRNDGYCRNGVGISFLNHGERFEYTFHTTGVFGYHSEPHPHMRGTVIVLEQTRQP